jgi:hypothetical protein
VGEQILKICSEDLRIRKNIRFEVGGYCCVLPEESAKKQAEREERKRKEREEGEKEGRKSCLTSKLEAPSLNV